MIETTLEVVGKIQGVNTSQVHDTLVTIGPSSHGGGHCEFHVFTPGTA